MLFPWPRSNQMQYLWRNWLVKQRESSVGSFFRGLYGKNDRGPLAISQILPCLWAFRSYDWQSPKEHFGMPPRGIPEKLAKPPRTPCSPQQRGPLCSLSQPRPVVFWEPSLQPFFSFPRGWERGRNQFLCPSLSSTPGEEALASLKHLEEN